MNGLGRPAGRDVVEYQKLAISFTTEGTEVTEKNESVMYAFLGDLCALRGKTESWTPG